MLAPVLPPTLAHIPTGMMIERSAHSFMNTSARDGSVNISPVISLTPASPPSNLPSSTSVAMP